MIKASHRLAYPMSADKLKSWIVSNNTNTHFHKPVLNLNENDLLSGVTGTELNISDISNMAYKVK
ncbi:MAG: hypothetical protein OEY00_01735 [Gammaproteobacteria bacterium]|nr:hypothetical protein [Gammaproteobacteria bacterium]